MPFSGFQIRKLRTHNDSIPGSRRPEADIIHSDKAQDHRSRGRNRPNLKPFLSSVVRPEPVPKSSNWGGPQSALKISDLGINAALISYRSARPPKPRMPIPDDILDQRPPVLHLAKPIDVHSPGVRTRDLTIMDHHPETILRQERVVVAAKGLKVPPARLGGEFVGQEDAEFSAANR
ncbi:MAG: hypothetical protein ASARMPRED_006740 [Alectoria sarmentosa]|nr:MAG: hypothetical protein ASARMPRED_006740 [Alectoria sarmentosa]